MEGRPISKNDIIEPGILESLTNELRKTQEQLNKGAQETQQNVKKSNSLIYETLEITEDLLRLQKVDLRLKRDIDKLKAKGNDITAKEAALLTQLKEQRKQNNRELNTEARLTKQVGTSMNELSQSLAKNKQAYRALTDEERKNNKVGGQLLKTISKQDKAIKKLDKTLGDNQRNVGNYGSALEGVSGQFGTLGGVLPQVKAGLNFVKVGFRSLKAAIISTGIGALVVALGSLVSYFTSTEAGAAKLNRIMVPLNAAWNTLTLTLQKWGEVMSRVFDQNIVETWNQLKVVSEEIGDVYKEETRLGDNLATITNLQHDIRKKNITELARLEAEVAKQRRIANDEQNYSLAQQVAGIQSAIKATNDLYDIKLTEAKLERSAAILRSEESMDDREAAIALEEAKAKVFNIEVQRDNAMRTILRRQTTLYNKLNTEVKIGLVEQIHLAGEREETFEQMYKSDVAAIGAELDAFVEAEKQKQEAAAKTEELRIAGIKASEDALKQSFAIGAGLFEKQTAAHKLLASASAAISTYQAANVALASAPPPYNFILMAATIAAGLANVLKINQVAFADGTESVQGGVKGKDSVNALLMPGERVLTVEQNKQLAGISNNDIPGLVRLGQQSTMVSPELIAIAHAQLSEQRNTNNLLGKWRIVEPDGTMRNLKNDEIKHYIN